MECFTHEKKSVDFSTTNDMSSCSIRNPKTFVASSSNATSKSLRKSNTKDYKSGRLPTLQEYCHQDNVRIESTPLINEIKKSCKASD